MRVQLIDYLPKYSPKGSCDLSAIACSGSSDPIVVVADRDGASRLRSVGIHPVATVTPSVHFPYQNKGRVERTLKRIGATTVVCRSDWCYSTVSTMSGFTPVRPDTAVTSLSNHSSQRESLRAQLGLSECHNLVIPVSSRPEQIDSLIVCLSSSALAIAKVPVVFLLPSTAKHIGRARAFLSNADRILRVIVTDTPSAYFAPTADAIIWGPHAIGEDHTLHAEETIDWARGFGVPVLCPSQYAKPAKTTSGRGKLYACNGTGAADVSAPLLSIFGSQA